MTFPIPGLVISVRYNNHFMIFIDITITRSDVPRDEYGRYGWTANFEPDSVVNVALRFPKIVLTSLTIIKSS